MPVSEKAAAARQAGQARWRRRQAARWQARPGPRLFDFGLRSVERRWGDTWDVVFRDGTKRRRWYTGDLTSIGVPDERLRIRRKRREGAVS